MYEVVVVFWIVFWLCFVAGVTMCTIKWCMRFMLRGMKRIHSSRSFVSLLEMCVDERSPFLYLCIVSRFLISSAEIYFVVCLCVLESVIGLVFYLFIPKFTPVIIQFLVLCSEILTFECCKRHKYIIRTHPHPYTHSSNEQYFVHPPAIIPYLTQFQFCHFLSIQKDHISNPLRPETNERMRKRRRKKNELSTQNWSPFFVSSLSLYSLECLLSCLFQRKKNYLSFSLWRQSLGHFHENKKMFSFFFSGRLFFPFHYSVSQFIFHLVLITNNIHKPPHTTTPQLENPETLNVLHKTPVLSYIISYNIYMHWKHNRMERHPPINIQGMIFFFLSSFAWLFYVFT